MEASVRDKEVVANLRAARRTAVNLASTGHLVDLFGLSVDNYETQV